MRLEFPFVMKGRWHWSVSLDDSLVALVLLAALIYTVCTALSLLPDGLPPSPGASGQTGVTKGLQSYSLFCPRSFWSCASCDTYVAYGNN